MRIFFLIVIALLVSVAGLYGQISAPVPVNFEMVDDQDNAILMPYADLQGEMQDTAAAIVEDSLDEIHNDIAYAEGLSLIPSDYWGRTVLDIAAYTGDYTSWADKRWDDNADGTHGDDATNYKTDAQGISLSAADADNDGIYIDFTNIDFTHFSNGDTSVAADYITIYLNIDTQNITDLGNTDGIQIAFTCDAQGTLTNYYSYGIDDSEVSNGGNYIKIAKSAFTENGTGDWSAITGFTLWVDDPDADVELTIDNIQMIKKAQGGAWPSPFQTETTNGTWRDDWTQGGGKNVTIVEESGRLGMMSLDGSTSNVISIPSFGDYKVSGKTKLGSATNTIIHVKTGGAQFAIKTATNQASIYDSSGSWHAVSFTSTAGDEIYWRFERKGSSITGSASHTGLSGDWATISSFGHQGALSPRITIIDATARFYGIGLSTVEHAAHASVADRLTNGLTVNLLANLTTHGYWDGKTARMDVDENSVGFSGALHVDADGNLIDCDADAAATMPCLVLAIEPGVGSGKLVLLEGTIVNTAWNWTIGDAIWVSCTVAALHNAAPSGSGDVKQCVGIALSADAIYFNGSLYHEAIP